MTFRICFSLILFSFIVSYFHNFPCKIENLYTLYYYPMFILEFNWIKKTFFSDYEHSMLIQNKNNFFNYRFSLVRCLSKFRFIPLLKRLKEREGLDDRNGVQFLLFRIYVRNSNRKKTFLIINKIRKNCWWTFCWFGEGSLIRTRNSEVYRDLMNV